MFNINNNTKSDRSVVIAVLGSVTALAFGNVLYGYWKPRAQKRVQMQNALKKYKRDANTLALSTAIKQLNSGHTVKSNSSSSLRSYNHETGFWQQHENGNASLLYLTPSQNIGSIANLRNSCAMMQDWRGMPQRICGTNHNTFLVTQGNMPTKEYVAVPYRNAQGQMNTLVQ